MTKHLYNNIHNDWFKEFKKEWDSVCADLKQYAHLDKIKLAHVPTSTAYVNKGVDYGKKKI